MMMIMIMIIMMIMKVIMIINKIIEMLIQLQINKNIQHHKKLKLQQRLKKYNNNSSLINFLDKKLKTINKVHLHCLKTNIIILIVKIKHNNNKNYLKVINNLHKDNSYNNNIKLKKFKKMIYFQI